MDDGRTYVNSYTIYHHNRMKSTKITTTVFFKLPVLLVYTGNAIHMVFVNSPIFTVSFTLHSTVCPSLDTQLYNKPKSRLCRLRLKCDGTRAETRFCLSAKLASPFKSAWGRQFSRPLAAEVCASAVVMLDTPCSEVV
jgi:hypothetical protein